MADTEFREKSVPAPVSLRAGVALLRTVRLASDPGSTFHYHNPNYWVAARLVEVVSGEPFAGYLKRHVFDPIGMNATTTVGTLCDVPAVARGHIRLYGKSVAVPEPSWYLDGSSGIVTTAEDLAQWLVMQNSDGVAANGTRVVSATSVDEMHDKQLGWRTGAERGEIVHGGWLFTFTAQQVLLPRTGYGLAVVANRGINIGPDDSHEIMRALVAMSDGSAPNAGASVGRIVELVLALLALLSVGVGARSIRRSRDWSTRWYERPTVGAALGLLAWCTPIVVLVGLRRVFVYIFGGRDRNWIQISYVAPLLVVWLAVSAVFGMAIIFCRTNYSLRIRGARARPAS